MELDTEYEVNQEIRSILGSVTGDGMSNEGFKVAEKLLEMYRSVFRIKIGNDFAANTDLYEVALNYG